MITVLATTQIALTAATFDKSAGNTLFSAIRRSSRSPIDQHVYQVWPVVALAFNTVEMVVLLMRGILFLMESLDDPRAGKRSTYTFLGITLLSFGTPRRKF